MPQLNFEVRRAPGVTAAVTPVRSTRLAHGRRHWRGDDVDEWSSPVGEVAARLPTFRRQPLAFTMPDGIKTTVNWSRDLILRNGGEEEIPVGVVSKQYRLVQHTTVLNLALKALEVAKIPLDGVSCDLTLTALGERVAMRFRLPEEHAFDPGDGHRMGLRLECFNSVDGSTRFMAVLGWLRFVCSNGLIIGVTRAVMRQRHSPALNVEDIGRVVNSGLRDAVNERKLLAKWVTTAVGEDRLRAWVDGPLLDTWGVKAAARAHHIATTGHDAELKDPFERAKPSGRGMRSGASVPGAPAAARNAFAISQALAWIARQRRDVQEQVEWSRQIPPVMRSLLR